MKATINIQGFLKNSVQKKYRSGTVELKLDQATSVYNLLTDCLGINEPSTIVLVNNIVQDKDYCLQEGDNVQIISPVSK